MAAVDKERSLLGFNGVTLENHHINVVERFECPHESRELCCLEPCANWPVGMFDDSQKH